MLYMRGLSSCSFYSSSPSSSSFLAGSSTFCWEYIYHEKLWTSFSF